MIDFSRGWNPRVRSRCHIIGAVVLVVVLEATVALGSDPPHAPGTDLGSEAAEEPTPTPALEPSPGVAKGTPAAPPPAPLKPAQPDASGDPPDPGDGERTDGCDVGLLEKDPPAWCWTPRPGTLSGGYLAFEGGYMNFKDDAERRAHIGPGPTLSVRLVFEFWDTLLAGIGIGFLAPNDRQPFSQSVVDCQTVDNVVVSCDDQAHDASSSVQAGVLPLELGVQHRLRPAREVSVVPGGVFGYLVTLGGPSRSVACDGCTSVPVDANPNGAYVGPLLRVTIGHLGLWGLEARSVWFVSGDLAQITTLGLVGSAP
jgi:hypothetical protein